MQLFTCWIGHRSGSPPAELIVLLAAGAVFQELDSSAWRAKQMFAAEITRLETESCDKGVQLIASSLYHRFPDIAEL